MTGKQDKNKNSKPKTENPELNWYLFDAKGKVLGRLATTIAKILQGKHKTNFVTYKDLSDHVVVVNAAKVQVTGKKEKQKVYTFYSGYPSGLKKKTVAEIRAKKPEFLIWHAVSGMLPKNKLKKLKLKKLHIFAGSDHTYQDKPLVAKD